jgi:hypothetical protein
LRRKLASLGETLGWSFDKIVEQTVPFWNTTAI